MDGIGSGEWFGFEVVFFSIYLFFQIQTCHPMQGVCSWDLFISLASLTNLTLMTAPTQHFQTNPLISLLRDTSPVRMQIGKCCEG